MKAFRRRILTDADRIRMQRLYTMGLSLKLIAERFGVASGTVKSVLLKSGVSVDSSNRRRSE